tara:strand:+ start:66 stop:239 length:174 start_codon:yes stop_codon:yes gene_type:complete
MTKKHFIKIAQAIKESTLKDDTMMLPILNKVTLINKLSTIFKDSNDMFDYDRFVDAC